MRVLILAVLVFAGCATVPRAEAPVVVLVSRDGVSVYSAPARARAVNQPPRVQLAADAPLADVAPSAGDAPLTLPTIPRLVKRCEPVLWGTVGSAVLGGVAIYMATSGVDTLNPDPSGPLPANLRVVKTTAGAVGAGTAILTAALTSILGQCREDASAPKEGG